MPRNRKFEKLLEPGYIGSVKTRNRIIKTGASMMASHDDDLHMNETIMAFYESIARGGVGLLIVESPIIDYPYGSRWRQRYRFDDDRFIQGMSELTGVVHSYGCPTFMQMNHDGPWQNPLFPQLESTYSGPPVAASAVNLDVAADFHHDIPRELTIPEIQDIVDKFASAAVRARKAGFDGIDINAGSSHLLHNFLSHFWNRRQDEYGGSVEKRARILLEIVREIKKRAGHDFPVAVCMNGIEVGQAIGIDNSKFLTAEDSRQVAQLLQKAGVDAIQIRNHWLGYHAGGFLPDHLFYPEPPVPLKEFPKEYNWKQRGAGANVYMTEEMKKVVSIPIIIVGKVGLGLGEEILREGKADFIAMTRSLFADPELPNKIASGRLDDVAPCTTCGTCLDATLINNRRCRINAALGTTTYNIEKAEKQKRVVIIGGGPAGMEAARVAALRGHEVILYEKSELGGLLPLAALVKGIENEDLPTIVRYLKTQLKKLGVKTKLGKEFNVEVIKGVKPDVVILAAGSKPVVPNISGVDKRNVITMPALHHMIKPYIRLFGPRALGWLTKFWMPIGKNVVIIGSGIHGCELAEFLVKRGRKVTIVDTYETPGKGMVDFRLPPLLGWFEKKGVVIMSSVKDIEITDRGLNVTTREGERQTIVADKIIPTTSLEPNNELLERLKSEIVQVYVIGDAKEPRMIVDAISDGWHVAQTI